MKLADYVVTEAGFGADLGAEKFFDIKCRSAGLAPDAVVLVATVRALKMHGGVAKDDLGKENVKAVAGGCVNLARHIENIKSFGLPVVVAVNRFSADTDAEMAAVREVAGGFGVTVIDANHWSEGGAGAVRLAEEVAAVADSGTGEFRTAYPDEMPIWEKIKTVATTLYRADDITADQKTRNQISAELRHILPVREVRLSAGAGFVVVVCGDIMTMPGLPRIPSANRIRLNAKGEVEGLF